MSTDQHASNKQARLTLHTLLWLSHVLFMTHLIMFRLQPRNFLLCISKSVCLLRLCLVYAQPECAAGCLVAHADCHARLRSLPAPPRHRHVCWVRARHGRRMRSEANCHRRRRLCGLRRRLAPAGGGAAGRAHRGGAVRRRGAGRRRVRRGRRPAAPLHAARAGAPAPEAGRAGLLMLLGRARRAGSLMLRVFLPVGRLGCSVCPGWPTSLRSRFCPEP